MFDAAPDVAAHGRHLFLRLDEFLVRRGHGADAAFDASGDEFGQEIKEQVCVSHAVVAGPIGEVDLFLHATAVEAPVGKSVDRENVAVLAVKPAAEGGERGCIAQLARGLRAQPQADGKRSARRDAVADAQGELLERAESLRPRLTAMQVGTVGEVESVIQVH